MQQMCFGLILEYIGNDCWSQIWMSSVIYAYQKRIWAVRHSHFTFPVCILLCVYHGCFLLWISFGFILIDNIMTAAGRLNGKRFSLSCGRSWVRIPARPIDYHHKNGANCLWTCMHSLGRRLTVQPDCLKGRVVCGTVYGEMHLIDLLGLIVRVRFCIPSPGFLSCAMPKKVI